MSLFVRLLSIICCIFTVDISFLNAYSFTIPTCSHSIDTLLCRQYEHVSHNSYRCTLNAVKNIKPNDFEMIFEDVEILSSFQLIDVREASEINSPMAIDH